MNYFKNNFYLFIDMIILLYINIKNYFTLYDDYIFIKLIEKRSNENIINNISLNNLINIEKKKNYFIYLEKIDNNKTIKYCENINNIDINIVYKNFINFTLDTNTFQNKIIEVDLNENITLILNKYFNEFIFNNQLVNNIYLDEINMFIDQLCNNDIKLIDIMLNEYIIKNPYNSKLILNNF